MPRQISGASLLPQNRFALSRSDAAGLRQHLVGVPSEGFGVAKSVIPETPQALSGIQYTLSFASKNEDLEYWIPAFAGMTMAAIG